MDEERYGAVRRARHHLMAVLFGSCFGSGTHMTTGSQKRQTRKDSVPFFASLFLCDEKRKPWRHSKINTPGFAPRPFVFRLGQTFQRS
jgi:hypothetical protein